MDHKKNIFSMYRVLLLAVALPLVAVLLGVTTASTKATSKEVKSLTKNYMLSIVEQCGSTLDSALFEGDDDALSYNFLSAKANNYTVTDVDSSYLYIVDGYTAEMLYHPTKEKVGKSVESEVLLAVGEDGRNDSYFSGLTILSSVILLFTGFSLDAYAGNEFSLYVINS